MEHDETGCQPSLDGPILCVNNCGFFGSPANMNMCSKCYKAAVLKQEAKAAVSTSIDNIVNGPKPEPAALKEILTKPGPSSGSEDNPKPVEGKKTTEGPNRCGSCRKRVGLTGFKCRCGGFFCGTHRYSEEHGCPFDYQAAGKDAIAKANPVVKVEKLDKI